MMEIGESKATHYMSKGKISCRLLSGSMATKEIWLAEISTKDFKELAVNY